MKFETDSGFDGSDSSGVKMKVSSPAKMGAESFKVRSKVGTGLAVRAPRESFGEKESSMDEFRTAAKVCRVGNDNAVVHGYLIAR
jgi:hypothetical protein